MSSEEKVVDKEETCEHEDLHELKIIEIPAWKMKMLERKLIFIEETLRHLNDEIQGITHNFFREDDDED